MGRKRNKRQRQIAKDVHMHYLIINFETDEIARIAREVASAVYAEKEAEKSERRRGIFGRKEER